MKINPNSLIKLLKEFNSNIDKIAINNSFSTIEFIDFLCARGIAIKEKQLDASSYNKIIIALAAVECGVDILTVS
ncbi:MAG: hypothetical protein L0H53_00015 [Candidatus Nitrosocosmicus sp.]|nr:hypothetical protein [Candidatus Nitrosocosmicus sp.]MDN5866747.1 hypothetical protein [Candidatus Nitrosocosmicus sp.]